MLSCRFFLGATFFIFGGGFFPLDRFCENLTFVPPVIAQEPPFYAGKSITLVVADSSGTGNDRWARLFANHLAKHIPGKPNFIVQNMPGAGGRVAANHLYKVAKPDGLTVGTPNRYIAIDQLVGFNEIAYDARRFNWIGSPEKGYTILVMRADAPYKTVDDIIKAAEPPKCGDQGTSGSGYQMSKLLEETLGAKLNVILGYQGGSEIDLAIEKGEVVCRASTIPTHFSREPFVTWHKTNFDRHLVQTTRKRDPRAADTPTIYELMDQYKTPEARRRTAEVLLASPEFGYPMVAPPGTPMDLVKILRDAYVTVLKDPEFQAAVKKLRLDLDPSTGEELQALVQAVLDQPSQVIDRVKKLSGK